MDFSSQAITYAFLIIPTLFALAVLAQGIIKTKNKEESGPTVIGFGAVFLILIIAAYIFFIR